MCARALKIHVRCQAWLEATNHATTWIIAALPLIKKCSCKAKQVMCNQSLQKQTSKPVLYSVCSTWYMQKYEYMLPWVGWRCKSHIGKWSYEYPVGCPVADVRRGHILMYTQFLSLMYRPSLAWVSMLHTSCLSSHTRPSLCSSAITSHSTTCFLTQGSVKT